MALVIPTGFSQVALEFRNEGDPDPWYVTFGIDSGAYAGRYEELAAGIAAAAAGTWQQDMHTSTTMTAVVMTVGQTGSDNLIIRVGTNLPGTSTQAKLPQNCALLVSKNSALGGRKNRGRFFIPNMLNDTAVDQVGVIDGGTRSSYETQFALFLLALEEGDFGGVSQSAPMVILHNEGVNVPDPTLVTSLSVSGTISTQRRRLR